MQGVPKLLKAALTPLSVFMVHAQWHPSAACCHEDQGRSNGGDCTAQAHAGPYECAVGGPALLLHFLGECDSQPRLLCCLCCFLL